MATNLCVLSLALLLLCDFGVSSAASHNSAASECKIVNGVFSNVVSPLMKRVLSLKTTAKTAITGRAKMKFESGFSVETVFDGSKLGIKPYSLEVLPNGDLLVLDSANSNLYKISSSLSLYSRPKLIAGSADGYSGHVDGKLREARMNHPRGLTVDDKGNIYIADTVNTAVRKISDTGVTTIARGKLSRGRGHGPIQDAKFSDDFDVVYIGTSCSLLVVDRGNRAIREIQLPFDDCAYQYASAFPFGIAVLVAAGFFGYMLGLLQLRVGTVVSFQMDQPQSSMKASIAPSPPYPKQTQKSTIRPNLIPSETEPKNQENDFSRSIQNLSANPASSFLKILGRVLPGHKKQQLNYQFQNQPPPFHQDSYVIPDEKEPPCFIDTRKPAPKKTYLFMTNDAEKMQKLRQSRHFYWEGDLQKPHTQTQQQYHNRSFSTRLETYFEQSTEKTDEIVFGAVQEHVESMDIKPLEHGYTSNSLSFSRCH